MGGCPLNRALAHHVCFMADVEPYDKKIAKELLIKAKVYRIMAVALALAGVVIFGILYLRYFHGDPMVAIQDPMIIIFVIFPFLPAIILSTKSKKAEKALSKLVSPDE